jgi:hypothetical protein
MSGLVDRDRRDAFTVAESPARNEMQNAPPSSTSCASRSACRMMTSRGPFADGPGVGKPGPNAVDDRPRQHVERHRWAGRRDLAAHRA